MNQGNLFPKTLLSFSKYSKCIEALSSLNIKRFLLIENQWKQLGNIIAFWAMGWSTSDLLKMVKINMDVEAFQYWSYN